MKKAINKVTISGKVYEHTLKIKQVQNQESANYGKDFIGGDIKIATDEEGLNIVTVSFTYVTPTTKNGTANATYNALKNIIENGKTIVLDGIENATMVKIDSAIGVNDFYNNEDKLVSAKRAEGGFVTIVSKIDDKKRNHFECDMLINGVTLVEADEEKHIDADYMKIKGAVFNFRNSLLPVEFVLKNPNGFKYFESLDASPNNLVFTKVWGNISSRTVVIKTEEEAVFGESLVHESERSIREWVIEGASPAYEFGDAENGITIEDVTKAQQERESYLATVKQRAEEYKASKAGAAAPVAASSAASGFNF